MTLDPKSDGDLLCAWRGGDQAAFHALVVRYEAALLRHARALLGHHSAPEDVVQETFLRLAKSPPDLPGDGDLGTGFGEARDSGDRGENTAARQRAFLVAWLHRVTRNLCMDALRAETRRRTREEKAAPHEAVAPDDSVDVADTRAAVERSLEHLPQDQREVLVLRLLADRSYREIAEITGRKVGTVGWLVSVGLKALAKELAPLLGLDGAHTAQTQAAASAQGGAR